MDVSGMSELEKKFVLSLKQYVESPLDDERSNLFIYYCRLLGSLSENSGERREEKLRLVISSLIEELDKAPDGEVSETLYKYVFRDFLESYSEEAVVREVIRGFLDREELGKLPLRIALGRYR